MTDNKTAPAELLRKDEFLLAVLMPPDFEPSDNSFTVRAHHYLGATESLLAREIPTPQPPHSEDEAVAEIVFDVMYDNGKLKWKRNPQIFKLANLSRFDHHTKLYAHPPVAGMDAAPIDMVLHCPRCGVQHVDAPEESDVYRAAIFKETRVIEKMPKPWTNPPHRSHLCHACGFIWRPADVATNGVAEIKTRGANESAPEATSYRLGS